MDQPVRSKPAPSFYLQQCGLLLTFVILFLSLSSIHPSPTYAASWLDQFKRLPIIEWFFPGDNASLQSEKSEEQLLTDLTKKMQEMLSLLKKNQLLKSADIESINNASGLSAWSYITPEGKTQSFPSSDVKQSFKTISNDGVYTSKSINISMAERSKLHQTVTFPQTKSYFLTGYIKVPSGTITLSYSNAQGEKTTQTRTANPNWQTLSFRIEAEIGEKGTISLQAQEDSSISLNALFLVPADIIPTSEVPQSSSINEKSETVSDINKKPLYKLHNGKFVPVTPLDIGHDPAKVTGPSDTVYIRSFVSQETLDQNRGRPEGSPTYYGIKTTGAANILTSAGVTKSLLPLPDVSTYVESIVSGCIQTGAGFFPLEFCETYRNASRDYPKVIVYKIKSIPSGQLGITFGRSLNIAIKAISPSTSTVAHELSHALGFDGHYDDYYTIGRNDVNGRAYQSPYYYTDVMAFGSDYGEHLIQTINRSGFDASGQHIMGPFPNQIPQKIRLLLPNGSQLTKGTYNLYAGEDAFNVYGTYDHMPSIILPSNNIGVGRVESDGTFEPNRSRLYPINLLTLDILEGTRLTRYYAWLDTSEGNLHYWSNPNSEWVIRLENNNPVVSTILWPREDIPLMRGVHFPIKAAINTAGLVNYKFAYAPINNLNAGLMNQREFYTVPASGILFHTSMLNIPQILARPEDYLIAVILEYANGSTETISTKMTARDDFCQGVSKDQCLGPVCTWKDECNACSYAGVDAGNQCPQRYCGQFKNATSCNDAKNQGYACSWGMVCDVCMADYLSEDQQRALCASKQTIDIIQPFGGSQPLDIFNTDR